MSDRTKLEITWKEKDTAASSLSPRSRASYSNERRRKRYIQSGGSWHDPHDPRLVLDILRGANRSCHAGNRRYVRVSAGYCGEELKETEGLELRALDGPSLEKDPGAGIP